MVTLVVDGSNGYLSVACLEKDKVLSTRIKEAKFSLTEIILEEIDLCLKEAGKTKNDLTEIIASKGPGSYTAIRVVATVCKTLAYSLKINIKMVSSLALYALGVENFSGLIVPVIDARRKAVFGAIYKNSNGKLEQILEENYYTLDELNERILALNNKAIYVGRDINKIKDNLLSGENISYNDEYLKVENIVKDFSVVENSDAYNMVPSYLRKTEAERELKDDKNK